MHVRRPFLAVRVLCAVAAVLLISAVVSTASAQSAPRASMESFQLPSHGSLLNALVYLAAGEGSHPVVVLLHGFPGNEKNLDLAQDLRRAGWDVLYFNYRGSWGSPGGFSFEHSMEDVAAALAYLRTPATAARLRLDPHRIVLIGHSMGGMMAVNVGAKDSGLLGIGLISAADMAGRIPANLPPNAIPVATERVANSLAVEGMAPLAGCTPESLAKELVDHRVTWAFATNAPALHRVPLLVVSSDDGLAPADNALADAAEKAGNQHVTRAHFPTDHAYSDQRLEMSKAVLAWIATLPAS
jgi:pimeloyl-ACP methyl ester carboxylesterase